MAELVSIENLSVGMTLAEPVVNNYGQTLIPVGIELSDKHIMLLKTWSINTVNVQGSAEEDESELSDELMELAKQKLAKRMPWEPRNKYETDLYNMGLIHNARLMKSTQGS